jgi:hypothetical protein
VFFPLGKLINFFNYLRGQFLNFFKKTQQTCQKAAVCTYNV